MLETPILESLLWNHVRCRPVRPFGALTEAFLKKRIHSEELDRFGNTMAQLVDGRADAFAHEYIVLFHSNAGQLNQHPDWPKLSAAEARFAWRTFALLLFQSASSFNRRVVAPLSSLPYSLLSMGRVRHDLPDERRKRLAKLILETPMTLLDINTLKIRNAFRSDLERASKNGRLGARLFTTIKAMRRMWRAEVRENERLNKQLKLFGERAPNSSLDLISARLALKFRLGTAGLRQEEMESPKPRNWTRVRPMAANVFDTCVGHWMDASSEVLSQAARFQEPPLPDWCPSKEEVHSWTPILQPSMQLHGTAAGKILSALVNRTLYQFLQGKSTGKIRNPSEFPEPYFSAIALVQDGRLQHGRPYRLSSSTPVYVFCETVNRAVRVLKAEWTGTRIIPSQPWQFMWGAEVVSDDMVGTPFTLIAFPVHWQPVGVNDGVDGVALEGTCVSKTGDLSLVTISFWEEDTWILFYGGAAV